MGVDVRWLLIAVLVSFVIARAFFRRWKKSFDMKELDDPLMPGTPMPAVKVRLTELQQIALRSATCVPIGIEKPRLEPLSSDQELYPKRTIDSLVERGLLEFDGKGGYTTTHAGLIAIRWAL
ncbi:hypothetical protein BOH74_00585 [Pseudomonas versuta]|uniref:Uncharacterized protein n=1 Tax=Pseudomonas versuta TaxID=1788301 RepID=A0A854A4W8_9PSED|nr:hypothetical protein [Pseudomonas versuta]OKA29298.1 hypothetical protein BOH74_00585 [Pseudomonas versuta]